MELFFFALLLDPLVLSQQFLTIILVVRLRLRVDSWFFTFFLFAVFLHE
jgi:hypothetical protein